MAGFSVTGMAYHNQWHATDQVPDRAIPEGLIDRYGEIDTTDGGNTGAILAQCRLALVRHALAIARRRIRRALQSRSVLQFHVFPVRSGAWRSDRATRQPVGVRRPGDPHHLRHVVRPCRPRTPSAFRPATTTSRTACTTRRHDVRLNAVTVNDIGETNVGPFVENRTIVDELAPHRRRGARRLLLVRRAQRHRRPSGQRGRRACSVPRPASSSARGPRRSSISTAGTGTTATMPAVSSRRRHRRRRCRAAKARKPVCGRRGSRASRAPSRSGCST